MIYKFNPIVFETDESNIQKILLRLLLDFLDDFYLWDLENITELFGFNEDGPFYSSVFYRKMLAETLAFEFNEKLQDITQKAAYITNMHKFYLTTISIGFEGHEIHPNYALSMIKKPSLVILENGSNDWNFIRGLILNYSTHKKKKSIFKLIQQAVDKQMLLPGHAGGAGEIKKILESLHNGVYQFILYNKIALIFDSDRESADVINPKWENLLKYLKRRDIELTDILQIGCQATDMVRWHMLYKRELENYLPLELLFEVVTQLSDENRAYLKSLTPNELDFYNFDKMVGGDYKNFVPLTFLKSGIRAQIEERCAHHKLQVETPTGILEEIYEPEQLMLMIAKII